MSDQVRDHRRQRGRRTSPARPSSRRRGERQVEIPVLCHDDRLEPAGACRICLVEIEGQRLHAARLRLQDHARHGGAHRHRRGSSATAGSSSSLHLADTVQDREVRGRRQPEPAVRVRRRLRHRRPTGRRCDSPRTGRTGDTNPFVAVPPGPLHPVRRCMRYCDEVEAVTAITLAGRGAETTIATADQLLARDTTCELCGGCIDVCPTGAMTEKPALAYGKPERELEKVRTHLQLLRRRLPARSQRRPRGEPGGQGDQPAAGHHRQRRQPVRQGALRLRLHPPRGPPDRRRWCATPDGELRRGHLGRRPRPRRSGASRRSTSGTGRRAGLRLVLAAAPARRTT